MKEGVGSTEGERVDDGGKGTYGGRRLQMRWRETRCGEEHQAKQNMDENATLKPVTLHLILKYMLLKSL